MSAIPLIYHSYTTCRYVSKWSAMPLTFELFLSIRSVPIRQVVKKRILLAYSVISEHKHTYQTQQAPLVHNFYQTLKEILDSKYFFNLVTLSESGYDIQKQTFLFLIFSSVGCS
uniref:Uncharacterized protein n=1 Tax=Anguilla anguilla TaxID=7936 RepID=A0A0E9X205_ANGAN